MDLNELLKQTFEKKASDLHITVGRPPVIRIDGMLKNMGDTPLDAAAAELLIMAILTDEQKKKLVTEKELDCSYSIEGARFRVNIYIQKNAYGGAFRTIPAEIPTLEDVSFAEIQGFLDNLHNGLIIVTGATGQGKSTTLAACVNYLNETRALHIMTMEDPIEFVHPHKKCLVNQREILSDTLSFSDALKHSLRQDPDIVLVGEMRDLETMAAAITLAETGHIVFTTLHTMDAAQTVDRIIDVFPPYQQQQVRMQLSNALKAVVSQQLIPKADGKGRVVAREVMFTTPAISNLIREGKSHQIYSAIQTGAQAGMVSMDQSLKKLLKKGKITTEDAMARASNPMAVTS